MRTALKHLSVLCAGTLLLACAGVGQRSAPPSQAALRAAPADADQAYQQARAEHLAGRFDAARQAYRRALAADPAHRNARNGLATLHAEQGEFTQAIAIWRELTASAAPGPASAFLFSNLGYAHFLNGEYEQALAALEKACLLDPLNHRAWQHLGSALAKLGQDERAQLMLRQASTLQEHDFKADYAIAPRAGLAAIDSAVTAHTEVRETASGMFELHIVRPAPLPAFPLPLVQAAPAQEATLLEIRNGNGVTGMARSLARSMGDPSLRVVRLSNQKGFGVRQTRIEYQPAFREAAERLAERFGAATVVEVANCKSADMRLVIGRDLIHAKPVLALKPGPRDAG